jgi:hypothetical protein
MSATPESLQKFVSYCQQHITGDEKGQAQVFLDRFFQAFGHEGALEAGATYEERVKKGSKKGKTGFADLVWKPRLLIEMKKRGEDNHVVSKITSSLKATIDVSQACRLSANLNKCFVGVEVVGKGFIVTEQQVKDWIQADPKNQKVLKLFSMGGNLAQNPYGTPERWVVDFSDMPIEEVSDYNLPFEHIRIHVKPEREKNREAVLREKWWRFKRTNEALRTAIARFSYYFVVPRVSKWTVFITASSTWLPGDLNVVVASEDFYILGILSSQVHRLWVKAQSSTLEDRTRYTHRTCFETFPFPQTPSNKLVEQIRATAQQLHQYRTQQMETKQWGITQLYNKFFEEPTSQLFKLHAQLDKQVMQAYGFDASDDILEKLLELNLELAEKEKRGETVVGPWAPH